MLPAVFVKVKSVEAARFWAVLIVIVVPDLAVTIGDPVIPVPVIFIPTTIPRLSALITTVVVVVAPDVIDAVVTLTHLTKTLPAENVTFEIKFNTLLFPEGVAFILIIP